MNKELKVTSENIHKQWVTMVNKGIIPIFEIELKNNNRLIVDMFYDEKGILFQFYQYDKDVYFDGCIQKEGFSYLLPFNRCFDKLDHYLQMIYENVYRGFLIPNDLI